MHFYAPFISFGVDVHVSPVCQCNSIHLLGETQVDIFWFAVDICRPSLDKENLALPCIFPGPA